MKIFSFTLIYFLASTFLSCNRVSNNPERIISKKSNKTHTNSVKKLIIQPLGQIRILKIRNIERALKEYYRGQIIINAAISLPTAAASSVARKYHAHKLLQFLSTKTSGNSVILGVTEMDICMNKNGNPNFGIFGLGQRPGNSCVISTCRLSGNNTNGKLTKVALHEIGHTQGLTHCLIPTCLMSDLKGRDRFNEMALFCNKCKSVFNKKGWAF